MIRLKNIDFTRYSPVQLRGNKSYFIYTIDKHELFDEAEDKYYFFCHPLTPSGEADFKRTVLLPKCAIISVPIRL
jgi:hypothetical protein